MINEEYICLVSIEGQYSLWPSYKEIPLGWSQEGPKGNKEKCLQYIKETWTDMRPISLRKQMDDIKNVENTKKKKEIL